MTFATASTLEAQWKPCTTHQDPVTPRGMAKTRFRTDCFKVTMLFWAHRELATFGVMAGPAGASREAEKQLMAS
jgi:hypothetical protein